MWEYPSIGLTQKSRS